MHYKTYTVINLIHYKLVKCINELQGKIILLNMIKVKIEFDY